MAADESSPPSLKQQLLHVYYVHHRKLLILPLALLLLAFIQIGIQLATTGEFVSKGISLKGGSSITILKEADPVALQAFLDVTVPQARAAVRTITDAGAAVGVVIESGAQEEQDIDALVAAVRQQTQAKPDEITIEVTGSAVGASFFRQTITALLAAFFLMAVVVFLYFRTAVPSLAVVLAAFSDIVITLAIFNVTGMKLDTAGIAAFLMLVGYSVDTDILLTSRVLKRKEGTVFERVIGAMKTGLMMTATTLVAVVATLLLTNSPVVQQIMLILLIGLLVDIINTWIQNASIVRWYLEKKHGTQAP